MLLKFVMESNSGFAYVYNTNAIEIVTRGRIWPRAFDYSNFFFFKGQKGKKNQNSYSKQKTYKQGSVLAKDMVTKWSSLREVQRLKASFRSRN